LLLGRLSLKFATPTGIGVDYTHVEAAPGARV
jgi:hypothetical protein